MGAESIHTEVYNTNSKVTSTSSNKGNNTFIPPVMVQKKLEIGEPNDHYEIEADRMADQVVEMKPIAIDKPRPNNNKIQRKCQNCEEEERIRKKPLSEQITPLIQAKRSHSESGNVANSDISTKIYQTKGGGHTLDKQTKHVMENGFGADFSNVRVHTDSNAISLSKKLNAQAFTVGNDIYFNEGKYNPNSNSGKHLLAHELTHTLQQNASKNKSIQKIDIEAEEALINELEDLYEIIDQADENEDYEIRNYFLRVAILLERHSDDVNTIEDFYLFKSEAENVASSEEQTILMGDESMVFYETKAFPNYWADVYYELLYLYDPDLESLRDIYEEFHITANEEAEHIPESIIERGFPIPFSRLSSLDYFEFKIRLASSEIEHPIKNFARAMLHYGRSKWRHVFLNSWNVGVDIITSQIRSSEITVDVSDYNDFIDQNYDDILQSFVARARVIWREESFEEFNDDIVTIQESQLITGFIATIGTLFSILFYFREADRIFSRKRRQADVLFHSLQAEDKVIAAIKWAYYNGYFADAGEEIWQQIRAHGWYIIGAVIVMLLALVAGHVFPPLGLALDVILIAIGGIDLILAIGDLVTRVRAASRANSIERLQKESGRLATALIGDGIRIILDLAGFIGGRSGINRHLARIEANSSGISRAEALGQAVAMSDEGAAVVSRAERAGSFLEAHSGSSNAQRALKMADGEAQIAEEILQVADSVTDVAQSSATVGQRYSQMTIQELRALASSNREAAIALIERYKTFNLSELRALRRRGDQTATYLIDVYYTTSTQRLVDLAVNGDRLALEVLHAIWPNAHGLRRAISTITQNRGMARTLAADLETMRTSSGILRTGTGAGEAVEGGTMAVARTDIDGLNSRLFRGASGEAGGTANPRYTPSNPIYPGHAEQNLLGRIAETLEQAGYTTSQLEGKTVFVRVEQYVCSSCRAGVFNNAVDNPGVILQFSREFPSLTIEITAVDTLEVLRIRNGVPVH